MRRSGSPRPRPSMPGAGPRDGAASPLARASRNSVLDLAQMSLREVNQLLHDAEQRRFPHPQSARRACARLRARRRSRRHDRRPCRLLLRRHEQARACHRERQCRHGPGREHDVGPRAREGRCLAVRRRDRLRRAAGDRRQCLGALRHRAARARYRGEGLGRAHVGLHGAGRQPGRARRHRRCVRRLALRGEAVRARHGEEPRRGLRREGDARRAQGGAAQAARCGRREGRRRRSSSATARRASSIISTSTMRGSTDERGRQTRHDPAARLGDVRRARDRRDPARRRDRHL